MVGPSRFALSACVVAALASVSWGQDSSLKPIAANGSVSFVKLSAVMNSKVLIQEEQAAGQVVDVVMNESGCIDYLVASYEEKYYAVPYSAVTFRGPDRVIFIDIAPTQFRRVTFFTGNQWPDFYATTYRQNVFNIFGVTSFRNDGPRRSLKPDLDRGRDRDRDDRDRDRDRDGDRRDRNDRDRPDGDKPKAGDTPRKDVPIPNKDADRPDLPRNATPPDRIKGDVAPESRDKGAPVTKPDVPTVKPELPTPPKPNVPKVEAPKGDLPKVEPLKPKAPANPANPK